MGSIKFQLIKLTIKSYLFYTSMIRKIDLISNNEVKFHLIAKLSAIPMFIKITQLISKLINIEFFVTIFCHNYLTINLGLISDRSGWREEGATHRFPVGLRWFPWGHPSAVLAPPPALPPPSAPPSGSGWNQVAVGAGDPGGSRGPPLVVGPSVARHRPFRADVHLRALSDSFE